jgi:hypothetical protein
MAINVETAKNTIKANLKRKMSLAYEKPEDVYDQFAGFIADAISEALQHVKDHADVTGVTAGTETIAGGID